MFYLGPTPLPAENPDTTPIHMLPDEKDRMAIRNPSMDSALEAVAWGLVSPDFVRTVIPTGAPPMIDRGWALESLWWNKMGRSRDDRQLMSELTIRDLIPLIRQHRLPPMVFNATCVETGQRVSISPLHVAVSPPRPRSENREDDWRPERERIQQGANREAELVSTPIDFLDFYNAALADAQGKRDLTLEHSVNKRVVKWADANVRLSTAVRLSATFSYVTPVARPDPLEGFGPMATIERLIGWAKGATTELEHRKQRLNSHYGDG